MVTIAMSVSSEKFALISSCLFVTLLSVGSPQDVPNNWHMENATVPANGNIIMPAYIRRRRQSSSQTLPCFAPSQPVNGKWKLHRDYCQGNMDCSVPDGTPLAQGSQLIYSCDSGYKLTRSSDVYCRAWGRWSTIPVCNEIRCGSLSSISTAVTCYRYGAWLNCDSSVSPGTQAEVSCRSGYRQDSGVMTTRRDIVICNREGMWEPNPIRCVSVCGQPNTRMSPLMMGGTAAKIGDFPWHASIHLQTFSKTNNKNVIEYLCGATVIQTNFLLTAAHCIYDESTRTTTKPEKLLVITGNTFSSYEYAFHNPQSVRKARVKRVYPFCKYLGLVGNYVSDIALLELEQPFQFSDILTPACLDDSGFGEQVLYPGANGKVAGFGRTARSVTSGNLQTMTLPYVSYDQCKSSQGASKSEAFISVDKFCAGYNNGSALCEGDSGGGLVFKKGDLWYLMGVVSVGLDVDITNGERKCNEFSYSLYTKVSAYTSWIKDILYYAEKGREYPACNINPGSCLAPAQPANGEYKLHQDPCIDDTCKISQGTVFQESRQLNFSCDPGFKIKGQPFVLCKYTGQWTPIPICIPIPDTPCTSRTSGRILSQRSNMLSDEVSNNSPAIVLTPDSVAVKNRWDYVSRNDTWQNDPCTLSDGSTGICILLTYCQPVLNDLMLGKPPEKRCGFFELTPIICCPMSIAVSTTTPGPVDTEGLLPTTTSLPDYVEDPVDEERGVIARRKCSEYSEYVYAWKCPPVVADRRLPVNVSKSTGKTKVERMEFPHMAAVGYNLKDGGIGWYCGGALISETFVLTAAHCTYRPSWGYASWVRLGDLNLVRSDDGATPQDRRIIERIRHPDYKPPSLYNDIALLRMATPVPFNGWIRPACLHTLPSVRSDRAIAAGWGSLDWADNKSSDDLMKVTLPLVDAKTCNATWISNSSSVDAKFPHGIIRNSMICAGAKGKDTCKGDSGGPLIMLCSNQTKHHCMYDVVGVISLGRMPCGSGIPGIYTRVYNYLPWIESIVWGEEEEEKR